MPRVFLARASAIAQNWPAGLHGVYVMSLGPVHLDAVNLTAGALPPFGRTPAEIGYEKKLIETIAASPHRRTNSKQELVELGMTIFGLSKRRAIALRERVIDVLDARAWSRAGARRRNRS
jgi:hypothetical protein